MDRRTATVSIKGYSGELYCVYDYYAGRPGRAYMPNGDPGYPPDDYEIDLISVCGCRSGMNMIEILSDEALYEIETACFDYECDCKRGGYENDD